MHWELRWNVVVWQPGFFCSSWYVLFVNLHLQYRRIESFNPILSHPFQPFIFRLSDLTFHIFVHLCRFGVHLRTHWQCSHVIILCVSSQPLDSYFIFKRNLWIALDVYCILIQVCWWFDKTNLYRVALLFSSYYEAVECIKWNYEIYICSKPNVATFRVGSKAGAPEIDAITILAFNSIISKSLWVKPLGLNVFWEMKKNHLYFLNTWYHLLLNQIYVLLYPNDILFFNLISTCHMIVWGDSKPWYSFYHTLQTNKI